MLNRFLLVAVWCLVLLLSSNAVASGPVRVGVGGGFNYSSLSYEREMEYWDTGGRSLFSFGAFLDVPVAERWSFVPGMRYVRYGNTVDFDTGEDPVVRQFGGYEVTQNQLSFPALFKVRPVDTKPFFVSFGPEFGFLLSARQEGTLTQRFTSPDSVAVSTFDYDIGDVMDLLNLSLDAGAGIEFPVGQHTGSVEVRYAFGVLGTAKETEWFSDWKTRGIEVIAGVTW